MYRSERERINKKKKKNNNKEDSNQINNRNNPHHDEIRTISKSSEDEKSNMRKR